MELERKYKLNMDDVLEVKEWLDSYNQEKYKRQNKPMTALEHRAKRLLYKLIN